MAYNTSQRFNDVLTPKCIASIGTKLATTTTTGTKPSGTEKFGKSHVIFNLTFQIAETRLYKWLLVI